MKPITLTAAAVAIAIGAPATAQTYEHCTGEARRVKADEIATRCARVSGQTRQDCVARIDEAYLRQVKRCEGAEQQRLDRIAAQDAETKAKTRQQALDAARRAGAPR